MWNISGGGGGVVRGITLYLVSTILSKLCDDLVSSLFQYCCTMYLVKEKQGGLILQERAIQAHQAFRRHYRVSPSPADPAGRFPLNFLNIIHLKFRVRAPNGCCIL